MSVDRDNRREIEDPGEASRRSQVDQLTKQREQIARLRTEGVAQIQDGAARHRALYAVTKEYARLLAPYLADVNLQGNSPIWTGEKYQWTVEPREPPTPDVLDQLVKWDTTPDPQAIQLNGIKEFAALPENLRLTFEWARKTPAGRKQQQIEQDATPPEHVLAEIVTDLDSFRRRVGLGLQLEDESKELDFE